MSHVTDVILLLNLGADHERVLREVNVFFAEPWGRGLLNVADHAGGLSAFQAVLAAGAFKNLPINEFLAHVRGIDWQRCGAHDVQILIKDEHDERFTLIESAALLPPE